MREGALVMSKGGRVHTLATQPRKGKRRGKNPLGVRCGSEGASICFPSRGKNLSKRVKKREGTQLGAAIGKKRKNSGWATCKVEVGPSEGARISF